MRKRELLKMVVAGFIMGCCVMALRYKGVC